MRVYCLPMAFAASLLGVAEVSLARMPSVTLLAQVETDPSSGRRAEMLTQFLRPCVLAALPQPLLVKEVAWGDSRLTPNGLTWRGQGLRVRPEIQYALKNHGRWQRTVLIAEGLPASLMFQVRNLQSPAPDRRTFEIVFGLPLRVSHEEQRWDHGIQLYATEVRCRLHAVAVLQCQTRLKMERGNSRLPDLAVIFEVNSIHLTYDQISFDHLAGLGGEAAEQLGRLLISAIRQLKPSLESDLKQRLEAGLLRAAQKKEWRVSLSAR